LSGADLQFDFGDNFLCHTVFILLSLEASRF